MAKKVMKGYFQMVNEHTAWDSTQSSVKCKLKYEILMQFWNG